MDVEHLFDGHTLVFYFLGDVPAEVEHVTGELAEVYEAKAQFRSFADTLTNGCGPGCGTESAEGHGCTNCAHRMRWRARVRRAGTNCGNRVALTTRLSGRRRRSRQSC